MLHALGLGYHANGVQCTADEIADYPTTTWRDCEQKEYGGATDVLGSSNSAEKISYGVSARLRYDLHWLTADNIEVLEKDDSPSDWTVTSSTVTLVPLDDDGTAAGNRAAIIRFTDATLSGLGLLWLEYRVGLGFDSNVTTSNPGILAFHWGNTLIDMDSSDGLMHVSLDVGAGAWTDPTSGLQLEMVSADSSGATVEVTFGSPPGCIKGAPTLNAGGYYGGYLVKLAKSDDLSIYQPVDGEGWGAVTIQDWIVEYSPYWGTAEFDAFKVIFSYQLSAKNNDGATCGESTMSVLGLALPAGWRVDEGACQNMAGGQATSDVCFNVAVDADTEDGAYEVLIEIFKEEDGQVSAELYPLWICVGGFNPWFMAVANDRTPPWVCTVGGVGAGVEPEPAVNPRDGVADVDCVESTRGRVTCSSVGEELYTLTTAAEGDGAPCTGQSTLCEAGDIPAKVDCVESTRGRDTCTSVGEELYTLTTAGEGDGLPCTGKSTLCVNEDVEWEEEEEIDAEGGEDGESGASGRGRLGLAAAVVAAAVFCN